MIIWIFVSSAIILGSEVYSKNIKYAFTDQATCLKMIEGIPGMKCIPVELMK